VEGVAAQEVRGDLHHLGLEELRHALHEQQKVSLGTWKSQKGVFALGGPAYPLDL
jgi:hypothetical protein